MDCGLVRYQQRPGEKVRLGFDPTVSVSFATGRQRGCASVSQEAMRQFVADVAPLPVWMMGIVVHDSGTEAAWDCYR